MDKKISTARDIVGVLEAAIRGGYPLMIMAEDIEQEALATLVVNKLRGRYARSYTASINMQCWIDLCISQDSNPSCCFWAAAVALALESSAGASVPCSMQLASCVPAALEQALAEPRRPPRDH